MCQLSYLSLLVHKKCSKPTINRVQNSTIWALIIEPEGHEEEQNSTQKGRKQKKMNKVELKSLKTIKCSFQTKPTPYGRRI